MARNSPFLLLLLRASLEAGLTGSQLMSTRVVGRNNRMSGEKGQKEDRSPSSREGKERTRRPHQVVFKEFGVRGILFKREVGEGEICYSGPTGSQKLSAPQELPGIGYWNKEMSGAKERLERGSFEDGGTGESSGWLQARVKLEDQTEGTEGEMVCSQGACFPGRSQHEIILKLKLHDESHGQILQQDLIKWCLSQIITNYGSYHCSLVCVYVSVCNFLDNSFPS